jgi:hypothetical protein
VEHLGSSMKSGHYNSFVRRLVHRRPAAVTAQPARTPQLTLFPPSGVASASQIPDTLQDVGAANEALDAPNGILHSNTPHDAQPIVEGPREAPQPVEGILNGGGDPVEVVGNGSPAEGGFLEPGGRRVGLEEVQSNVESVWYYVSDQHVRKIDMKEVLASEAYVLLYQRRT